MSEFEAVLFRYVPDEGAGEALNVGLAMRTTDGLFFRAELNQSWTRVSSAFPGTHTPTVRAAFQRVREHLGRALDNPTGQSLLMAQTLSEVLRSALHTTDGALQFSEPVVGVTEDPSRTFQRLWHRYIEQHEKAKAQRQSRTDDEVKQSLLNAVEKRGELKGKLRSKKLESKSYQFELEFEHCWKNGHWNCLQPVSLDLVDRREIQSKAFAWIGNVKVVRPSHQDAKIVLFVGLPGAEHPDQRAAAASAVDALKEQVGDEADVYLEDQADELAAKMEADVAAHALH